MQSDTVRAAVVRQPRKGRGYWIELLLGRTMPALFFSVFIVYKMVLAWDYADRLTHLGAAGQLSNYLAVLNQLLGLGYFILLAAMYATRLPKQRGLKRVETTVIAFFGTFSVLLSSFLPGVPLRTDLALAADIVIAFGLGYTLWGLGYLRRSFSIMPEARRLVTGGPYRLSRHPLYFGEGMAAVGIMLPTGGFPAALLLAFFLTAQFLRIRWEEQVLEEQFPTQYIEYKRCVPRYLPRPWRLFR